ncbi:hypothetical protein PF008_g20007 [Phytophthora fragariae]|uniref:Uncharacterized protein n=1 Tax=Phytophthora fragariae TaxID=53985 RepID=A0A6G0R101_9STRA|nr:hypothetical protein PF008_g20007 [Phytophthora fragariae]
MSSTPVKKTVPPGRKRCKKPRSHQTQRQGVEPRVLVPGAHDDVAAPDQSTPDWVTKVFTDLQAVRQAQDSKIEVLREEIKVQDAKIELLCKVNEDQDAKIKAQSLSNSPAADQVSRTSPPGLAPNQGRSPPSGAFGWRRDAERPLRRCVDA